MWSNPFTYSRLRPHIYQRPWRLYVLGHCLVGDPLELQLSGLALEASDVWFLSPADGRCEVYDEQHICVVLLKDLGQRPRIFENQVYLVGYRWCLGDSHSYWRFQAVHIIQTVTIVI